MALSNFLSRPQLPGSGDYQREAQQDVARQQAQAAQLQQQQLGIQSARDEQENKRRSLAVSMLNGIAREQDPAKQAALYSTLRPMAERYDPTLKLPEQYDPLLTSALGASQVSPKEFFDAQKPNLPQGYRMNPQTGQAELIPGVDESFGRKADPYAMPMPVQLPDGNVTYATKRDVAQNPGGYSPPPAAPVTLRAPAGYRFGADGQTLEPLTGGPADPANKPITEYQGKSGTFAARMTDAEAVIRANQQAGLDPAQRVKGGTPLIGNYLVSDEYQQLTQAERNFVNAVLRQESGAAIGQAEFDNAVKQYFPQPGDTPGTLAQKAQNRDTAIAQMEKTAGRAFTPRPSGPTVGTEEDGFVFLGGDPAVPQSWKAKR